MNRPARLRRSLPSRRIQANQDKRFYKSKNRLSFMKSCWNSSTLWPRPMAHGEFLFEGLQTSSRLACLRFLHAFVDFNSAKARIPVASLHNYRHTLYWYYVSQINYGDHTS